MEGLSCDSSLQMWQYEGAKTLGHYLQRRDCMQRLAEDMQVIPLVGAQLFMAGLCGEGLQPPPAYSRNASSFYFRGPRTQTC